MAGDGARWDRIAFKPVQSYSGATPTAGTPAYDLQRNFRWLLASVMDTNGNSVKYNYNCDHAPVCYPSTIEYNGSKFHFITSLALIIY